MVKIKKLIPSDVTLNLLAQLHGPVTIARPVRVIAGITQIYLFASGDVISIITSYHDVVFKFEIFALQAEPVTSLPPTIELGRIGDWDEIVCLFGFEWLRPAKKGELPAGYGPPSRRNREKNSNTARRSQCCRFDDWNFVSGFRPKCSSH